ncbi:hypothetical protein L1987_05412 [Smallanthus sonchifolius]|uniref:Uncharacterized protein n=2 Tax=Smallanthus sonchifolius TaxID=185202 RepID=A0ACB9JVA0_9ASTR|nr:hypothetical protein L1987_05409 [Smallanthus sonchifolius]KAI3823966.1 hypothetical protein L1987_05412 [Smallanthus sonchifolius]
MIWLFVVFIVSSSYTANLTSMLTLHILEPRVRDIEWLSKNNAPVGCDLNSFVGGYLTDVLKLKNVINVTHLDKYHEYFKNGNIRAAFLELSCQKQFLKEYCNEYTVIGPTYKFGGLGFVFPKDAPITGDVSRAILTLLENGTIRAFKNEWLDTSQSCSSSNPGLEAERLSLTNFWGIFLISGLTSTLSLLIFVYRLLHNQIKKRIVSFKNSRWNNESRWRKAVGVVKIVLSLNHNQVQPRESLESANEWDQRNSPGWERVSPTELPGHLEIGRPTQLDIPMRNLDRIGED